jgi:hypothetical protein
LINNSQNSLIELLIATRARRISRAFRQQRHRMNGGGGGGGGGKSCGRGREQAATAVVAVALTPMSRRPPSSMMELQPRRRSPLRERRASSIHEAIKWSFANHNPLIKRKLNLRYGIWLIKGMGGDVRRRESKKLEGTDLKN